jgi:hypothetical protein
LEAWCNAKGQCWNSATSECELSGSPNIGNRGMLSIVAGEVLNISGIVNNNEVIDN